jgi:hypothetical protein
MRIRRGVLTGAVAVTVLAAGLTFVPSAAAVPTMAITNSGGVPILGTQRCQFMRRNQICRIRVTNNSAFAVEIVEETISGPEPGVRYAILAGSTCRPGSPNLAMMGGSCEAEVRLLVDKPVCAPRWLNGYNVRVQQAGVPTENLNSIEFLEVL